MIFRLTLIYMNSPILVVLTRIRGSSFRLFSCLLFTTSVTSLLKDLQSTQHKALPGLEATILILRVVKFFFFRKDLRTNNNGDNGGPE